MALSSTRFDGFQPMFGHRCNMGTLICWWGQRSYIKVKGHLRSSYKIGWKCENGLIWKVEVRFEPNLVYWYNMWTFICSCSQRSCTKVKGHLRSSCKITWKCKFWLFCIIEDQLELPKKVWGSRSDVILHHPQTATASDTSGPGTANYFYRRVY